MIGKNSMKNHYLKNFFCSHLNMEDITDADYAKGVYKDFEIKDLENIKIFIFKVIHYS